MSFLWYFINAIFSAILSNSLIYFSIRESECSVDKNIQFDARKFFF